MRSYADRKHLLLVNIIRTMADATTDMDIDTETEAGAIASPVFRYMPQFEFDEEDMQTIRELAEEEGEDYSTITGEDEP